MVLYRQHARNQIGAIRWDLAHVLRKTAAIVGRDYLTRTMRISQQQAAALLERFGNSLPGPKRSIAEAYINLGTRGFFERRWEVARHGFYRSGWLRNLAVFARI